MADHVKVTRSSTAGSSGPCWRLPLEHLDPAHHRQLALDLLVDRAPPLAFLDPQHPLIGVGASEGDLDLTMERRAVLGSISLRSFLLLGHSRREGDGCQSALEYDPGSACNIDPRGWVEG